MISDLTETCEWLDVTVEEKSNSSGGNPGDSPHKDIISSEDKGWSFPEEDLDNDSNDDADKKIESTTHSANSEDETSSDTPMNSYRCDLQSPIHQKPASPPVDASDERCPSPLLLDDNRPKPIDTTLHNPTHSLEVAKDTIHPIILQFKDPESDEKCTVCSHEEFSESTDTDVNYPSMEDNSQNNMSCFPINCATDTENGIDNKDVGCCTVS